MRVLFFGDMAPSGFGTVTTNLGREMLNLGVDIRFISQNDTGGEIEEPFRSRTTTERSLAQALYPGTREMTGEVTGASPVIPSLIQGSIPGLRMESGDPWSDWKPDAILMLSDFRAAQMLLSRAVEEFRKIPTVLYLAVEGSDLPPAWAEWFEIAHPVAMSKFGAKQIAKVVGHPVPTIYHGVDTELFRPVEDRPLTLNFGEMSNTYSTRIACKEQWGRILLRINGQPRMPRKWLLRTDRNMPRKQYARMLRSLAPVLERNPNWALVIHCGVFDKGGMLSDSASKYPRIRDRIFFTDLAIDPEALVLLYNAADLYVSNSAEGFGLTIAEALACGVPAVGVRYSAVPEVIGPAGVTVDRFTLVDNEYDHYWCAVDEKAFGDAVETLMSADAHREALGAKGPKHIRESFSWSTAARAFVEVLESEVAAWHPSPASPPSGNTSSPPAPRASSATASSVATSS